jgi:hypothetical protein
MKVIPIETRKLTAAENQIREGMIRAYRITEGEPGPDNFAFKLVNIEGHYFSPRHRHNFDQIRLQLEGEFDYAGDGRFRPGSIGYFPESVRYGPQTTDGGSWNLLLQFGGASGSGYTAEVEEERAAGELKKTGVFANGVYTWHKPDGTKVNQDAYEAVWEHIHRRPLVYAGERYEKPVFMNTTHFDWVPFEGKSGIDWKPLGLFTEREMRVAFFRLAEGASLDLDENSLYFVLAGAGQVRSAGNTDNASPVTRHTTLHLERGEQGSLVASEPLECVQLRLPRRPLSAT